MKKQLLLVDMMTLGCRRKLYPTLNTYQFSKTVTTYNLACSHRHLPLGLRTTGTPAATRCGETKGALNQWQVVRQNAASSNKISM